MRTLYIDPFSGISGDMFIGALLDLGLPISELRDELSKLNLPGYKLTEGRTTRKNIAGTKFSVEVSNDKKARNLSDIESIISESGLDDDIKERAIGMFMTLAVIEAEVHDTTTDGIHFHEVGAVDAIVDIVGSCIALKLLGVERVRSARVQVGTGFVECQHGTIPIPSPATIKLLEGIPIYSTGIKEELVTPTGALILKELVDEWGNIPEMKIERVGYGAGERELSHPNLLRVYLGNAEVSDGYEVDEVVLLETNIDDMTPEIFGYVSELLFKTGALDVWTTPVYMKKNRPAFTLSVLVDEEKVDDVLSVLFNETTSFGVRWSRLMRYKLAREIIKVDTGFGEVRVKVGRVRDRVIRISPEYEDCSEIAKESNIPFSEVYEVAKRVAGEMLKIGEGVIYEE